MSWSAYIDSMELGKSRCKYAGIYGRNPVCVWAESQDKSLFPITIEDVTNAIRAISCQDINIMTIGMKIGGKLCFTCLLMDQDLLILQGKGDCKNHSLVIALSGQSCIIGFNPDADIKTACVREIIEGVRDYLRSVGY